MTAGVTTGVTGGGGQFQDSEQSAATLIVTGVETPLQTLLSV